MRECGGGPQVYSLACFVRFLLLSETPLSYSNYMLEVSHLRNIRASLSNLRVPQTFLLHPITMVKRDFLYAQGGPWAIQNILLQETFLKYVIFLPLAILVNVAVAFTPEHKLAKIS